MTEEAMTTAPAAPEPVAEAPASQPEPASEPAKAEAPRRSTREALEEAARQVFGDDKPEPKAEKPIEKSEAKSQDGPARGPDGKFVAKDAVSEKPEDAPKEAAKPEAKPDDKTPLNEPPARFSADAKAAWKDAPEAVKGEVRRAIAELETGIQRYRQTVEPLKPFMDMAAKSGTTVQDALQRYVAMEQTLRADPARGLRALAQNMGMTPADMVSVLTGQQPEGDAATTNAKDREIVALRQEINNLRAQFGQVSQTVQQTREQAIMENVTSFAAQNPRFEELSSEIVRLLETGYASDLRDAYEKAARLNPAPAPAAPPPPAPAPQPRPALSVTGAPSSGSNPAQRRPSATTTEALERAFRAVGL